MTRSNKSSRKTGIIYRLIMGFIGLFDRFLGLSCRAFIKRASEKYERPLRRGEKVRQSIHRVLCGICRKQEKRMDSLRLLTHRVISDTNSTDEVLTPSAEDRMKSAMFNALNELPPESETSDKL